MSAFTLKSLTYQEKVYQSASAEVDEQARRLDLSYVKESFMKKERIHLAAIYYDERTKVETAESKVTVGDAQMLLATPDEASALSEVLKAPFKAALNSLRDLISGPAARFLAARAETLVSLDALRTNYRKSILEAEKTVSLDTKDPFADVVSSKLAQLERPLAVTLEAFDGFLGLSPPKSEKPYAFLYGVCQVQDAKFRGESLLDATQTLAALGLPAGDDARDATIGDITDRLVRMAVGQPQLLY